MANTRKTGLAKPGKEVIEMFKAIEKAFQRWKLRKAERLKNRKMVVMLFQNGIIRKA